MKLTAKYDFFQIVILKTDKEKLERMVTHITFNPANGVRYCLMQADRESWHYEQELDVLQEKGKKAGFI